MSVLRALRNSPAYTFVALFTLALGIGVNTSMFSLVTAVVFRALPFPQAERLVQIRATRQHGDLRVFAEPEQREIRGQVAGLDAVTTVGRVLYASSEPGQPAEHLQGVTASADLFATLGIQPLLGRAFTVEETQPGKNQVVLLTHSYWAQHYGSKPEVLGKTLRLDGQTVSIIGVLPPSFDVPALWGHAALLRPLNFTHDQIASRDYRAFWVVGRLKPGVEAAAVASSLVPLAASQFKEVGQMYSGLRYRVVPFSEALLDETSGRLYALLLALSGFVLLLACANLANLQLARATAGMRDLAIRAALGASRGRLVWHQLSECLAVSAAGGALGLVVAYFVNGVLAHYLLEDEVPLPLNGPVLVIALLVSLATGVLFGIVPAWLVSRVDLNGALKQQSRGSTSGRGPRAMRAGLIVSQVALALVLLAGAGIIQRGFSRFLDRDCGWTTSHLLTAYLPLPESRYETEPQRVEVFQKIERQLAVLPGVEHAALASSLPLNALEGERSISIDGQDVGPAAQNPRAFHVMVTPDFFATMGIPFVEGRNFSVDLKAKDPLVIIVNESLAKRLWPGQSPLGRRIRSDDAGYITWAEVIGVVRDIDTAANFSEPSTRFQIYKPMVHEPWAGSFIALRGPAAATLSEELRRAVAAVDPDLAVDAIATVPQFIAWQQRDLRLIGGILGGFALLGLVLAAVGVYSVVSHTVAQRTGEFGIRLALGAPPENILKLVLRQGLGLAGAGLLVGLAGAFALGRFLGALMPRLGGADPVALASVSGILILVALVSCWVPARRATRVDPLVALRSE